MKRRWFLKILGLSPIAAMLPAPAPVPARPDIISIDDPRFPNDGSWVQLISDGLRWRVVDAGGGFQNELKS